MCCIPSTALLRGESHKSSDRHTLICVMFNPDFSGASDPTPFPDEACTPKKITMDDHAVKAPHVLLWIFAAKLYLIRKNVDLHSMYYMFSTHVEEELNVAPYVSNPVLYNSHICSTSWPCVIPRRSASAAISSPTSGKTFG